MEDNWKSVYSADKLYKVELVKGTLDEHNIEYITMNKKGSGLLLGEIELFVDEKDYEKARAIVVEHHKESE
jgi:ATP sulfurylase